MKMTCAEAIDKLKDGQFQGWLQAHVDRADVIDMIECFERVRAMHMRAMGDLPGKVQPLWDEFKREQTPPAGDE